MTIRRSTYLCAALVGAVAVGYHAARLTGRGAVERTRLAIPLDQLPSELNGWTGEDIALPEEVVRTAAADAYLRRDYKRPDGETVSLYIAFYGSVKDRVPHGPTVCYPYQGWSEELNEIITVPSDTAAFPELEVRKLLYSKAGARVAVLYWYAANGKQQVDATWQKFDSALLELIGGGGSYVFQLMVSGPIIGSDQETFARLKGFLGEAFPAVARHLPAASPSSPDTPGNRTPPG